MWPETNIGELAEVDCPCGNVTSVGESLRATRYCGGDFTHDSQWRNPNVVIVSVAVLLTATDEVSGNISVS